MFSMSEVVLLANLKHQERLSEVNNAARGVPLAPRIDRGIRVASALRALAARLDPDRRDLVPARARLTPAK
jgi:hypothetical protein